MKKLFVSLIALGVMLWAGQAFAAKLAPVVRCIDSTNTSLTIEIDSTASAANLGADSLTKIVLFFGTSANPSTRRDSLTTCTCPDTIVVSSLHNGTTYYFNAYVESIDTSAVLSTIKRFTSAEATGITKNIVQTIAAISDSTSWRRFLIKDTYSGADSAFKKIAMQYRKVGVTTWTWAPADSICETEAVGRDSTGLASVDTLWAVNPAKKTDLSPNTSYEVRVVAWDSTGTDTSNTLTITTSQVPCYPTAFANMDRSPGPNSWDYFWTFTNAKQSYYSGLIDRTDYKTLEFQMKLGGEDNNFTYDSAVVYLLTDRYGVMTKIDTLMARDIDTTNTIVYTIVGPTSNADSVVLKANDFGTYIQIQADMTDSATSSYSDTAVLDPRYLGVRIIGHK